MQGERLFKTIVMSVFPPVNGGRKKSLEDKQEITYFEMEGVVQVSAGELQRFAAWRLIYALL